MSLSSDRTLIALNWFLRMPLLGAYELAMLMGEDEEAARSLIGELKNAGWLWYGIASSPEVEPDRLFYVSPAGVNSIASALGCSVESLTARLPVGEEDVRQGWQRLEITVGVNRCLAELVAATRRSTRIRIESLQVLPRKRRDSVWYPGEVEAYGCLRVGQTFAPFFLAWDRAAAPVVHRRMRVNGWYAFRRSEQPWGYDGLPSILVLSANLAAAAQWEAAILSAAERRSESPLPGLITEIDALFSGDPLDSIWWTPGGSRFLTLAEHLQWRGSIPVEAHLPHLNTLPCLSSPATPSRTTMQEISSYPPSLAADRSLGATEMRILEWLGFHPLLTNSDLVALTSHRLHQVRACLEKLLSRGFIDFTHRGTNPGTTADDYYFLSREGLGVLAARDGVPARRLARYGSIAAEVPGWKGAGRFDTLLREFEHTVGINRFFVSLMTADQRAQARVVRWLGASDGATTFTRHGAKHWLRPDGVADLHTPAGIKRVLLEWDRGTVRPVVLREKWPLYAEYFASLLAAGVGDEALPRLLVVTTTSQREQRIWEMAAASFEAARVPTGLCATTLIPLVDRYGPCSRIWRTGLSDVRQSMTSDGTVWASTWPRQVTDGEGHRPSQRSPDHD
ncbi:MAG: hypothetical protein GEU75_06415 [Dehalococcoidia bacterium]|nr:hypothetical protein [Dehalococcoidia bacterium]